MFHKQPAIRRTILLVGPALLTMMGCASVCAAAADEAAESRVAEPLLAETEPRQHSPVARRLQLRYLFAATPPPARYRPKNL